MDAVWTVLAEILQLQQCLHGRPRKNIYRICTFWSAREWAQTTHGYGTVTRAWRPDEEELGADDEDVDVDDEADLPIRR